MPPHASEQAAARLNMDVEVQEKTMGRPSVWLDDFLNVRGPGEKGPRRSWVSRVRDAASRLSEYSLAIAGHVWLRDGSAFPTEA
jgi:hypothetical protein